jgi:hypothetical protein
MEHNLPSSSGIPVGDDDTLTPSSILQENQHLKLFTKSHYANEHFINYTVPTSGRPLSNLFYLLTLF